MTRWWVQVGICVLLVSVGIGVHAAKNRYLAKAKRAYENLEYTRVTPMLNRALKVAQSAAEEVEIYSLFATIHIVYSREEQAREAFKEVLRRDPYFDLSPDTSPKILAALADAREEMKDQGSVALESSLSVGSTDPRLSDIVRQEPAEAFYTTWWFWTIVGVAVAVGGSVAAYQLVRPDYPERDFGPIPLR